MHAGNSLTVVLDTHGSSKAVEKAARKARGKARVFSGNVMEQLACLGPCSEWKPGRPHQTYAKARSRTCLRGRRNTRRHFLNTTSDPDSVTARRGALASRDPSTLRFPSVCRIKTVTAYKAEQA